MNADARGGDGGATAGRNCPNTPRVRLAVRHVLSEEISSSSSSSLPSLPSELKAHLAACAACAAEAAALDPTLVFAPLAASVSAEPAVAGRRPAPPVAEDARRVAEDVLDEMRRRARVTTPVTLAGGPSARRFRRFAQAAALVLLAVGLAGVVRWERLRAPNATVQASETPGRAADLSSDASVRPLIEGMGNSGARVYEFAAASPQEPAVVFVANPNADL
jgi:anti-sigma factor RsiW